MPSSTNLDDDGVVIVDHPHNIDPAFETIDAELSRAGSREYLKEMLCSHSLWHNGGFWDKALWHCAIEQVSDWPGLFVLFTLCYILICVDIF